MFSNCQDCYVRGGVFCSSLQRQRGNHGSGIIIDHVHPSTHCQTYQQNVKSQTAVLHHRDVTSCRKFVDMPIGMSLSVKKNIYRDQSTVLLPSRRPNMTKIPVCFKFTHDTVHEVSKQETFA
jgi:hypothetical protein